MGIQRSWHRNATQRRVEGLVLRCVVLVAILAAHADAATVPSGFIESPVATGLANPTAMQFAPDGRLFVCEQGGRLRVIKDGVLLSTPFVTLNVNSNGERGLLGVAFDPNFAVNQYVYVYYTTATSPVHNRISRFTAQGDIKSPSVSEVILFELDNLSSATNHNGGALAFGPDGKLYAAVGENANGANAQTLSNVLGKMLRLNPDGTIPTDNPFYTSATGKNRAIWALGLRNPFTFAFDPSSGIMYINDVGQNTWEEINDGVSGANYGWPNSEGVTSDAGTQNPHYQYNHSGGACAITGGAFYLPGDVRFPATYATDYFFADYCAGWIKKLESTGSGVTTLATGIAAPVDLKMRDGALYYLARGTGATTGVVYRIEYDSRAPTITTHPASQTVAPGSPVTFSVRAAGAPPLRYQWRRNSVNISGATSPDYTIAAVTQADDGAMFQAVVSNDIDSVLSNPAFLDITTNEAPAGTITQPAAGTSYGGGSVISYAGTATDSEDGTLPPSAFTWRVDFHHDTHMHPFMAPASGATGGSFTVPTTGETATNVWYRIHLTVRDSGGATHTTFRDISPRIVRLTLATNPAGLQLRLDAQPISTPLSFDSVVGVVRNIEAVSPQAAGGTSYQWGSWSDGGAATHNISTPTVNTTYTATYTAISDGDRRVISIDFAGSDGMPMAATESAGVIAKANWNAALGSTRSTPLALKDETGATTAATVTWTANNLWSVPITNQPGNRRMMRGYLDTSRTSVTTVTVAGLPSAVYDVYVYADGDNGTVSRTGAYRISGTGITTTTINLTDAANTNFNASFAQALNSNGNYVKFSITATGFTLTATPGAASNGNPRAPINGIQIVRAAASPSAGPVISVDFAGNDGATMAATESAGVIAKGNWNAALGSTRSTPLALKDETGATTAATVTWTANNLWSVPITDQPGNRRMMRGYLDTSRTSVTTVTVAGLPSAVYDIYVYADGDNGTVSRTGAYRISGAGITTTTINLTDAANTNFNASFAQALNSNGNYVKFSITATGFTLTATPGAASNGNPRAPINGIQVVPR